jgi:hypothetical protein
MTKEIRSCTALPSQLFHMGIDDEASEKKNEAARRNGHERDTYPPPHVSESSRVEWTRLHSSARTESHETQTDAIAEGKHLKRGEKNGSSDRVASKQSKHHHQSREGMGGGRSLDRWGNDRIGAAT